MPAGGDLAGTFPNPAIAPGAVKTASFASDASAPDAAKLGGLTPDNYMLGVGKLDSSSTGVAAGFGPIAALTIPNLGEVDVTCGNPSQANVLFKNTSGGDIRLFTDTGLGSQPVQQTVTNGSSGGSVSTAATVGSARHVTYLVRSSSLGTLSTIDVWEVADSAGACVYFPIHIGNGRF